MEWTDDGIVLGVRRHGEGSAIVELLTRAHGRHLGLVRGGASARLRPLLQPGNSVRAVWRARLDEHLGTYAIDGLQLRAASLMASSYAVYGVTHLAALARLLPERDPHESIFDMVEAALADFEHPARAAVQLARFELAILSELGFGLDLSACAATGATEDLIYVSPKSGNAVSRSAGEPWRDRLFMLPPFLLDDDCDMPSKSELNAAFALTGFFLMRNVLEPRGQQHSDAREGFLAAIARARQIAPSV